VRSSLQFLSARIIQMNLVHQPIPPTPSSR
jgi:hypothetical protein